MYRFLLEAKWVALTVLLVLVVPLSVVAADWQWNRWESRKAQNAVVLGNLAFPVAPLDEVLSKSPGGSDPVQWRTVNIAGRYLDDKTVLVRRQVVNSRTGFIVVTPLATDNGRLVAVERGFIPLPPSGTPAAAPPAPTGAVTVTGRVRNVPDSDLEYHPADLPAGQVNRIDLAALTTGTSLTAYPLVLELTGSSPPDSSSLVPLPLPEVDEGPHLSYVGQWGLIGLASIVVWIIVVRREASFRRQQAAAN